MSLIEAFRMQLMNICWLWNESNLARIRDLTFSKQFCLLMDAVIWANKWQIGRMFVISIQVVFASGGHPSCWFIKVATILLDWLNTNSALPKPSAHYGAARFIFNTAWCFSRLASGCSTTFCGI
jgi:hypothetical protein